MLKRALCLAILATCLAVLAGGMTAGEKKGKGKDDPKYNNPTWVPTAPEVIDKMLELAKVNKDDMIFDLGCGDNVICFTAAKKFRCRGVGIELYPDKILKAMQKFEEFNKDDAISVGKEIKIPLVETRHGDALAVKDLSDATIVVMYMFPEFMSYWFPIAEAKLKPGTRIVSHDYEWEYDKLPHAWKPVTTTTVKSTMRESHKVIMWVVPEKKKNATN